MTHGVPLALKIAFVTLKAEAGKGKKCICIKRTFFKRINHGRDVRLMWPVDLGEGRERSGDVFNISDYSSIALETANHLQHKTRISPSGMDQNRIVNELPCV